MKKKKLPTAEIRESLVWTCPACGARWYSRLILRETRAAVDVRNGDTPTDCYVESGALCGNCGLEVDLLPDAESDLPMAVVSPGYSWDCDSCGLENFGECEIRRLTEDEAKDVLGVEEAEDEEYSMINWPTRVKCSGCRSKFDTVRDI